MNQILCLDPNCNGIIDTTDDNNSVQVCTKCGLIFQELSQTVGDSEKDSSCQKIVENNSFMKLFNVSNKCWVIDKQDVFKVCFFEMTC